MKTSDDVKAYRWQQQLYLQSRSLQLREALIARGLESLAHQANDGTAQPKAVDWDCALATEDSPKSCLYSFDAPLGAKVVAPIDTQQWITLSALNRLRRTDPTKVEPLWHSQYQILNQWFKTNSPFSLYSHLKPLAAALSLLLDSPVLLAATLMSAFTIGILATLPIWEGIITTIVLHPMVWQNWPQWGRFVHAALPLKLLLGQMAWKFLANVFGTHVYGRLRNQLIEWECELWEECMPLTIVEEAE